MRYRLTNIIAGVREQAYQQGRKDAMRKSEVITEDVIMQKRETI